MSAKLICRVAALGFLLCPACSCIGEPQTSSCPEPAVGEYPSLPEPWSYLGCTFDIRCDDGKAQTNFFLDRLDIYSDQPGQEMINAGHHGGTHMVVQYRDPNGTWHWRPAVYPDRSTMPDYPPVSDSFSACYFARDPENPGAYWVGYQRSDPNGTHALWYMSPRSTASVSDQPFEGHALLTCRNDHGTIGDPICRGGYWNLPSSFALAGRSCLLAMPTGYLASEPRFRLEPPRPCDPNEHRDYLNAYGLTVLPRPGGDDVLFKTAYEGRNMVIHVPNKGGRFDLADAGILLDQNEILPNARWKTYFFSAAFLGLFPSEDDPKHYDLVVPMSLEELTQPGPVMGEHVVHTYIRYPRIDSLHMIGVEP